MYKKRLVALGIPPNIQGFMLLNDSLELYGPGAKLKVLFATVGEKYGLSLHQVERSVRHAISKVSTESNSQFIARYKLIEWADDSKTSEANK